MKFSKIKIPICFVFRVEGFVFSHVADEGWIDSCAGELLRYAQCTLSVYERIFQGLPKRIKGSDRLCKVIELSMQCCR